MNHLRNWWCVYVLWSYVVIFLNVYKRTLKWNSFIMAFRLDILHEGFFLKTGLQSEMIWLDFCKSKTFCCKCFQNRLISLWYLQIIKGTYISELNKKKYKKIKAQGREEIDKNMKMERTKWTRTLIRILRRKRNIQRRWWWGGGGWRRWRMKRRSRISKKKTWKIKCYDIENTNITDRYNSHDLDSFDSNFLEI